ncbi:MULTISPECIES: hypothetical protein [unclassified Sphingomonas]|uniref:hypothetical protein n=1 Tax=unclassified Sphingomonas TaxID=196159 RepID=UPI002269DFAA|nr:MULTISPECIES: hypothetical protein [unclassified Sphingomonas]
MIKTRWLAAVAAAALLPTMAAAQDHEHQEGMAMPMPAMGGMAHQTPMAGMADDLGGMAAMIGSGAYVQGSGTARLPADEGAMRGKMIYAGNWMLMAHGYAWGVATDQGGPRGASAAFIESMAMLMGDTDLSDRLHLQLRGMASLEPAMGQRGFPNLFATGEVADGAPLVDRQHPHDLMMELSARVDYRLGSGDSLFVYAAPVGEPALGPSAFMHRGSARYLPMSPISHHWFDSTHITYGVVTAGYAASAFQLEASAFRGREPDEHRWDIETPALDSWSVRGSWTPSPHWAVQVSHGRLDSPEEQHPGEDEARTTASVQYATGGLATTVAYALKDRLPGRALSAWLGEASWEIDRHHVIFGRVENVANDELFPDEASPLHDAKFRVTKVEAGYAYRLRISGPLGVALGGTVAGYAKPAALDTAYGDPVSWTLFAKFALGI